MPTFEMVLLIRKLDRANLKEVLKRSAGYIFEFGGTLRSMENLGFRCLPFMIRANGKKHIQAHCFIFNFDASLEKPKLMKEKFAIDLDIVRACEWIQSKSVMELHTGVKPPECTLHEDLQPVPYRKKVINLQELAKKKVKRHTHKNYGDTDFLIF